MLLELISTRRNDNYQMDTAAFDNGGGFTWPLEVLRRLANPFRASDTAALACSSDCESDRPTFLPVSFSQPPATERASVFLTVLVLADVELESLSATLYQGDKVIFKDLAVGGRYLPPHRPIRIAIQGVQPGEALISLAALTPAKRPAYQEARLLIPEGVE